MAPVEDLQSRDLAWISDFVMQQVAIMMHPVMEHLEQTDDAADYTQRTVERLSTDITELRNDLECTNKYLGILRQGLGMQNESRCMLQRTVESTTRTVGRLDDNMDNLVGVIRRVEDSIGQLSQEIRGVSAKHLDLAKQASDSSTCIEDLQSKIECISMDNHALKDALQNSEARLDLWQRDLRELRRGQLGIAPKIEEKSGRQLPASSQCSRGTAPTDTWLQKKGIAATATVDMCKKDCSTPESDGDSKHKRMSGVGSTSRRGLLQPELKLGSMPRSSTQAVLYESIGCIAPETEDSLFGSHPSTAVADEAPSARLPLLSKQSNGNRPNDSTYGTGLRLRFSETLARQPSRGSLN
jgi:prefoldin subunit 5